MLESKKKTERERERERRDESKEFVRKCSKSFFSLIFAMQSPQECVNLDHLAHTH